MHINSAHQVLCQLQSTCRHMAQTSRLAAYCSPGRLPLLQPAAVHHWHLSVRGPGGDMHATHHSRLYSHAGSPPEAGVGIHTKVFGHWHGSAGVHEHGEVSFSAILPSLCRVGGPYLMVAAQACCQDGSLGKSVQECGFVVWLLTLRFLTQLPSATSVLPTV